ncbi:MAG TPA: adenylate kinase [Dehalococcoidia bacterium]|nr:adenylate kinase [Dehalococcoidia bacterium]
MYLILLGAPGSGKGTQAKILAERFKWLHLSTGDMLREAVAAGTDLGKTAKGYMDAGSLVPDDLIIGMLVERIGKPDAAAGFVLDGFPRNLAQAQALDAALADAGKAIDIALNIAVPDEELLKRLGGRWICRSCGAIYHEVYNPSKIAGRCDACQGELYQRDDDRADTVKARLELQRPPKEMLAHYKDSGHLVDIDGVQNVEGVTADLLKAVENHK